MGLKKTGSEYLLRMLWSKRKFLFENILSFLYTRYCQARREGRAARGVALGPEPQRGPGKIHQVLFLPNFYFVPLLYVFVTIWVLLTLNLETT